VKSSRPPPAEQPGKLNFFQGRRPESDVQGRLLDNNQRCRGFLKAGVLKFRKSRTPPAEQSASLKFCQGRRPECDVQGRLLDNNQRCRGFLKAGVLKF